jgi:hypothetical protein
VICFGGNESTDPPVHVHTLAMKLECTVTLAARAATQASFSVPVL